MNAATTHPAWCEQHTDFGGGASSCRASITAGTYPRGGRRTVDVALYAGPTITGAPSAVNPWEDGRPHASFHVEDGDAEACRAAAAALLAAADLIDRINSDLDAGGEGVESS